MLRAITIVLGFGFLSMLALCYLARSHDEGTLVREVEKSLEALRAELFKH